MINTEIFGHHFLQENHNQKTIQYKATQVVVLEIGGADPINIHQLCSCIQFKWREVIQRCPVAVSWGFWGSSALFLGSEPKPAR